MVRVMLAAALTVALAAAQPGAPREISRKVLRDKIEGAWAGQMIGVAFGAPTEFASLGRIIEQLPSWNPGKVSNALGQDDLYVDMTLAKVLDDKGLDATSDDFGAALRDAKYPLWHANMAARRALQRGVPGSMSGHPKHNAHADDIDFQIEADFIGVMTPGLLQSSNDIALRAGRVMNYGDGLYGGMFVSCMYAAAFFEDDPRKVVEAGLSCIPPRSPYALLISDVLQWSAQHPQDWKKVWSLIEDKWDRHDACPTGALTSYNIDAKLNGSYIVLGLVFGARDFGRTIEISTAAGQDSDCNPASAAGILGVMLGYSGIPDVWKRGIPAIADKKFSHTDFTFRTVSDSTEKRALAMIRKSGGTTGAVNVVLKQQPVKPPKLELWTRGNPVERIATTDQRWQFKGDWSSRAAQRRDGSPRTLRTASVKGEEAQVAFEGTGAVVSGPYLKAGGTADAYVDGKLDRTVDVYSPDARGGNQSVFHIFGLKPGKHTIRILVRGEPFPGSEGTAIGIDDLIVYR